MELFNPECIYFVMGMRSCALPVLLLALSNVAGGVECPAMQVASADGTNCVCVSGSSIFNARCRCDAGHQPNSMGTGCEACSPGRYKRVSDSVCKRCPDNESPSADASTCECVNGTSASVAFDAHLPLWRWRQLGRRGLAITRARRRRG